MTTAIYHNGAFWSDSLSVCNDVIVSRDAKKCFEIPCRMIDGVKICDEFIATMTGVRMHSMRLLDYLATINVPLSKLTRLHFDNMPSFDDSEVITYDGRNLFVWNCGYRLELDPSENHSWGTGGYFALAALRAKAKPYDAVQIAISLDPFSGGNIQTVRIEK